MNRRLLPIAVLLAALVTVAVLFFFALDFPFFSRFGMRVGNAFSFYLLGRPPHFYYLDMEKNGQDLRLRPKDYFELSYRDEFVIKAVSSDDLFGRGISIDVEGIGGTTDRGRLLKGIQLIDNIVREENGIHGRGQKKYNILVLYHGEVIAALPIKVDILPQDWLRYARSTDNSALQIEYLKRAIAMNARDANVVMMLAGVYKRAGLLQEAIGQYRRALAISPDDLRTWTDLVQCYMKVQNYGQAIEASREILRLNPQDAEVFMNIALAYGGLGQWDKAIANYAESLRLNDKNPLGHFKLGEAYEKAGHTREAIAQYKQVIARAPRALNAFVALASAELRVGEYDEAIKWFREALGKQPRNATLWADLGLAYGGKGLWKEEAESYRKSLALNPNDPLVRFNLAAAYEKGKKAQEAAAEYQKVLLLKPDDLDALQRLAGLEMSAKKYEEATRHYERIVKLSPKKAVIYANLGLAYGELGRHKLSADNYEKAIKNGAKEPQLLYNLAYAYEQLGKMKEAIGQYEKYALAHPTVQVMKLLGAYYVKEKQYDNALVSYKKLASIAPRNAQAYSGIAHVYALKGDADKEIEFYKLSLRYDPEDDGVYLSLGAAYESKEMYAEAYRAYVKAYELNPDAQRAKAKIPQMRIRMLEKKIKNN